MRFIIAIASTAIFALPAYRLGNMLLTQVAEMISKLPVY